jgi:hypothetical protein
MLRIILLRAIFSSQRTTDFWFPPQLHNNGLAKLGNFLTGQIQRALSIGHIKKWSTEGIW